MGKAAVKEKSNAKFLCNMSMEDIISGAMDGADYAVVSPNNDMYPWLSKGNTVFVSKTQIPKKDDYCVVCFLDNHALIRKFVSMDDKVLTLATYGGKAAWDKRPEGATNRPYKETLYQTKNVKSVHKVTSRWFEDITKSEFFTLRKAV